MASPLHFNSYNIWISPPIELQGFVKCFLEVVGESADQLIRQFPSLQLGLAFNLKEYGLSVNDKEGNHILQTDCFFVGATTRYMDLQTKGTFHAFYVVLNESTQNLFGYKASDLTNIVANGVDINKGIEGLHFRLIKAKSFHHRIEIIESYLKQLINRYSLEKDNIASFIQRRIESTPLLKLKQLEKETGYSIRRLEQKFTEHAGMNMRDYRSIIRMQHLLKYLKQGKEEELLSVAVNFGFYDLAYFCKMFKQFTGFRPSTFQSTQLFQSSLQSNPTYLLK